MLEKQTLKRLCKIPFVLAEKIAHLFEIDEKTALKKASKYVTKLDNVKANEERFEEIKEKVENDPHHLHINIFDEAHHSATNQGVSYFSKVVYSFIFRF